MAESDYSNLNLQGVDIERLDVTLLQGLNEFQRLNNERTRLIFEESGKKRDYNRTFGYPRNITYNQSLNRTKRNGIAKRLLEKPAVDTWSDPPCLIGKKVFIERFNEVISSCDLFNKMYELDKLAGMDSYAIMVIGLKGDTSDMSQPVSFNEGAEVAYLQQYPAFLAPVKQWIDDVNNPRYNMPESYSIRNTSGRGSKEVIIHHSRVLHVAEGSLVNNIFGHPRLWTHWNTLDDLVKVVGGSAEMHWFAAYMGLHVNIPGDKQLKPGTEANLNRQLSDYHDGIGKAIRTRDVEITPLGGTTVDPSGLFQVLLSSLAIESGIPLRILLGTEAGALSSEQDRANWAKEVDNRRNLFIEPIFLNPMLRLLVNMGVLPEEPGLQWEWESGFKLNRLERGRHAYDIGRALVNVKKTLLQEEEQVVPGQQVASEVDNVSATETAKNFIGHNLTGEDYSEEVLKKIVDLAYLADLFGKEISDKDAAEVEDPNRVRSAKIPRINLERTI